MRKIIFILTALIIIYSCRSTIVRNEIQDGTWLIGTVVYSAQYVKVQDTGNTMTAIDLNSNGLTFRFDKTPEQSGNYRIVGDKPQGENQLAIYVTRQDSTEVYATTGSENKSARVSVNGGLITIDVPKVEAENIYIPGDFISIQALITEK